MPAEVCMFCGGSPLTNEHVWQGWLSDAVARHPGVTAPEHFRLHSREDRSVARPIVGRGKFALTARCVCDPCNSRWMNQIDEAARPFIESMIHGHDTNLDRGAQSAIAAWIALRTAVAWKAHPPRWEFPPEWLDWIYEHGRAPSGWRVWLARWEGNTTNAQQTIAITERSASESQEVRPDNGDLARIRGFYSTFLACNLVIKVAAFHGYTGTRPRGDFMLPIHPSPGVVIPWPPRRHFDEESADVLFDWPLADGTSGMGENFGTVV